MLTSHEQKCHRVGATVGIAFSMNCLSSLVLFEGNEKMLQQNRPHQKTDEWFLKFPILLFIYKACRQLYKCYKISVYFLHNLLLTQLFNSVLCKDTIKKFGSRKIRGFLTFDAGGGLPLQPKHQMLDAASTLPASGALHIEPFLILSACANLCVILSPA